MRVVFMGTPDFAVSALDAVHADHDVVAVYTQPPRPAGRGKKDRASPVQDRAETLGIPVFCPTSFKEAEAREQFASHGADIAVVVAYGLILPQAILNTPAYGCLNIHASLLPRWRGAAPIHRAILAGDAETGVCIMQMDAGLDTGAVLLRRAAEIAPDATTGSLHDNLSTLGATAIKEALAQYHDLIPDPQDTAGVTYAEKIDKSEAKIDWSRSAVDVDRLIRGLSPFPGAWCLWGDQRLKLLNSRVVAGSGAPGEVLSDDLTIACGDGAVQITRLQRAGKGAQDAQDFQRGARLDPGTVLT